MQLNFTLALIAGLVSFLSPCVLPLVPAYIGYMGGRVTNTVVAQTASRTVATAPTLGSRFSTLLHGLAFVAGFTFVFVAVGLLGTAFVGQIGRQNINAVTNVIARAGGLLIILFGLHFMGVLPALFNRILARRQVLNTPLIGAAAVLVAAVVLLWIFGDWLFALPLVVLLLLWLVLGGAFSAPERFWTKAILMVQRALYTDTRREMVAQGHQSYAGSAMMGVVFSAGWTPCIGPIYGAILTLALTGNNTLIAGWLLLAYSLGLGIPFLLTAFLLDRAQGILRRLQRSLHAIELISGAFLIAIGILVASGQLQYLSQLFSTQVSDVSYNIEVCSERLTRGEIGFGDFLNCVNGVDAEVPAASPAVTSAVTVEPQPATTAEAAGSAGLPSILDLAADAPPVREIGLEVGKTAPDFTTVTVTGETIRLADLRGKVVLINFWATWCAPCRVEMPEFEQAYAAQAGRGLAILGVNNRESRDDVIGFRGEFGLTFPLLMDERGAIQDLYAVLSYPSTYVIDRSGVIRAQHFGALTAEQIAALVDEALA